LIAALKNGLHPKYLFFWGHHPPNDGQIGKQCFSQWWDSSFELNGVVYPTAEYYMMAEKTRLFGDNSIYEKILISSHPNTAKKLGREVKGFDAAVWSQHCFEIVVRGNVAKFEKNPKLTLLAEFPTRHAVGMDSAEEL
jgi:ribA/ribD-fused uncharacterized protein